MSIEKIMDGEFQNVPIELLENNEQGEILISTSDLAAALGVAPATIRSLVFRNDYLDDPEFSFRADLRGHPRIFTEDGVYEILMLMEANERAKEFRRWLRGIVKQLRKGETTIVNQSGETVVDSAAVNKKLDTLLGSLSTIRQMMAIQEERMDYHEKLFQNLSTKIDAMNVRGGAEEERQLNELRRQSENAQALTLSMMSMLQDLLKMQVDEEPAPLEEPTDLAEWRDGIEEQFSVLESIVSYRPYSAVLKMVHDMGVDTEAVVHMVKETGADGIDALDAIGWFPEYRDMLDQAIADYTALVSPKKHKEEPQAEKAYVPGFMKDGHQQVWGELILPLATARNDQSVSHCVVYREVYRTMKTQFGIDWEKERNTFIEAYGVAPSGIQEMIRKSTRLYDVMAEAVRFMLNRI